MKRINIALLVFFFVGALNSQAQQNLFGGQDIKSGVVNDDQTVTFRFIGPHAKSVQVAGDFVEIVADNPIGGLVGTGLVNMTKETDSLWTYTSRPLQSDLYSYLFVVDGIATIDINNVHVYRDFATISNVFVIGNGQADLYKVNDIPHGTLAHRWYKSTSLGVDRRVNIYTPPGYESSDRRYPVLYLLHGSGGDENEWVTFGRAVQIVENLIHQGKAEPMILVIPNGHVHMQAAPGESSWGYYKPEHFRNRPPAAATYEQSFPEIIDFVDSNYRTLANKEGRAIAGLSMGGGHSMRISRMYENTFDYVGLFSAAGAVTTDQDAAELKKQFDNGLKLYWMGIGTADILYNSSVQYRAKMDEMGLKYTYVETEHAHIWKCWRIYLSLFTPLLFK